MNVPKSRPQMKALDVRRALQTALEADKGLNLAAVQRDCPVMFLANRAYYLETMGRPDRNDFGTFDDAAWIVTPTSVTAFNWNVDPSAEGWNASLGKPYANLMAGVWPFIRGQHKGKGPAWRQPYQEQAEDLDLGRYFTDGRAQGLFKVLRSVPARKIHFVDEGYHAINIHWASRNGTSSWGCQTAPIAPVNQWEEFQQLSYQLAKSFGQSWVPYALTEGPI